MGYDMSSSDSLLRQYHQSKKPKKYATKNNLNFMWEKIDNMLSEWYNMTDMFVDMKFKEDSEASSIYDLIDRFDPSHLIAIKNTIEELIEEKEANEVASNETLRGNSL